MEKWSDRVKAYRKKRGLIQAALAYELNVDVTTVSRWERGLVEPEAGVRRRLEMMMSEPITLSDQALKYLVENMGIPCNLLDDNFRSVAQNKLLAKVSNGQSLDSVGRHVFTSWPEAKIENSELYKRDYLAGFMQEQVTIRETLMPRPNMPDPNKWLADATYTPVIGGDRRRYLICTAKKLFI